MTTSNPWKLTPRQSEVLDVLTEEGESNKEIAKRLGIQEQGVKCHMIRICGRMGARGRVDAALMWDRWRRAAGRAQA